MNDRTVLSTLLASPFTAVVGTDLSGTVTIWSAGAAELYGWSEAEALGGSVGLIVPADRAGELADLERRVVSGEPVPAVETVRVTRDGVRVPVSVHLLPLCEQDELVPSGIVRVHHDLRPVLEARQAQRHAEQASDSAFVDSPVALVRCDDRGRISLVNRAMAELLGRDADALVGQDALTMVAEPDRVPAAVALDELTSGRRHFVRLELGLPRPGGEELRLVATGTAVRDATGGVSVLSSMEDVTALRSAEEGVHAAAARFDALVETMPVAVFTFDRRGTCTSSRGLALGHLGLVDDELVGTDLLAMYASAPDVLRAFNACLRGEEATLRSEASGRSWEGHYRPLRDADGVVVGGIGIALDMTERAAAEQQVRANEARLRSLLRSASDIALVLDRSGRIVYVSPSASSQLGHDERSLFWRSARDFGHPEDQEAVSAAWRAVLRTPGSSTRLECRIRRGNGSWSWAEHVLTNLLDDPAVQGVVLNLRDTSERRRADGELQRLALHDVLTGLPDRALLLDRTGVALTWSIRDGGRTGLVVVDVAGMTGINETVGQTGGDQVLRALASRLREALPAVDTVARTGADQFAVLVEEVASAEQLRSYAAMLRDAVRGPVDVGGTPVELDVQVGTALSPAEDGGALLLAAERAVARGPGSRRVRVARGDEDSGETAVAVADLRRGIAADELELHYQPVLQLSTGAVLGAEALVRWQHPERGLLSPDRFVPLAETAAVIGELGDWVMREACRTLAGWSAAGRRLAVGVNLSPRQLVDGSFAASVAQVLAATGAPPELLVLEVTESALMDDPGAPEVLTALQALGVRLALDDFGTGYSSLTYLKRFPVAAIKIDRSFVAGLGKDADDEAIVASVARLGQAIGKTVVAEGVETPVQLAALRALGVDEGQGFLWSPAVPHDAFQTWVDARGRQDGPAPAPALTAAGPGQQAGRDDGRILAMLQQGASLHTIAAALNADGSRTPAGPRWTTKSVARVVARLRSPA